MFSTDFAEFYIKIGRTAYWDLAVYDEDIGLENRMKCSC
jgi:hypothetical protein